MLIHPEHLLALHRNEVLRRQREFEWANSTTHPPQSDDDRGDRVSDRADR
jgi:hypothetical protein